MDFPPELSGLALDRQRLLKKIAPLLKHAGPAVRDRNAINRNRRHKLKGLKFQLHRNAEAISAVVMELYDHQKESPYLLIPELRSTDPRLFLDEENF